MSKDPLTLQEIEDYLEGNLSPEYLAEFERRLLSDEKATLELMQLKKVIEGIKGYAFRQKLQEYHKTFFTKAGDDNPSSPG